MQKFVADQDAKKREKEIDELLGRKEFVDMWALKWSELLQIRTDNNNQGSYKATLNYYTWLRDQLEKKVPINIIARDLISANGSNLENPAANYYQIEQDPLKLAEDTAQAFFGIRIQCRNVTIIRSTAGRWKITAALWPSSPRSAGRMVRTRGNASFSIAATVNPNTPSAIA